MFQILIVEDDKELSQLFQKVLEKNGYQVKSASDGAQALEVLDKEYIDLIISDIMMPVMDGYELVSELRSAGYQIPVLMITAKGSFDDMRQGFLSGSDDYMVKPVNVNEMVLRVGALLRRAQILNEHKIVIGSTEFDYDAMTVTTDKESLVLPKKEFLLLYKLAASPGRTFTILVFANAQTGNIVLLAQNLIDRNWSVALRYFSPLLFFALGVAAAECIHMRYQKAQRIHWRQLVLAIEILLLFAVGFFPNEMDLLANAMVSFACAMQVQAFRKVNGYAFASTMCIGNLRSGMESLCAYGKTKDKKILRKSGNYFGIIFLFAVGAALGGHMIGYIGARTIWISCIILLISFLCMFIKEEKKEHPEIVQEEREIRENLQNIRKEAKDVEHILEDDIRSQIEK